MKVRVFLLLLLGTLVGCDPFHVEFEDVEPAERYEAASLSEPDARPGELRVMTWNVKFGGGRIDFFFDCFGDRVLMKRSEVLDNLAGLAEEIRRIDPDVLLLQEVDRNSKRSAFVDQVQWLLDHSALNYGVYASQWRADYIPSDGLGAMDSGNAILARWPLTEGTRMALPLRGDQDALTTYFYLRRNLLTAHMPLPDGTEVGLVATHTAAYSKDGTKQKHIARFSAEVARMAKETDLVIAGGDLNTLPPGSTQQYDFDDTVCTDEEFIADDYTAEADWLSDLYATYNPAIPLADYQADNARYFGHTVDGRGFWNRKLDYLFTDGEWQTGSGVVHQGTMPGELPTMPLSDHAPLSATVSLP